MIVTVALPWFDEPVDMLEDAVRSVGTVADRILAIDGAYARYPGAKPASPPEQAEAICRAAESVRLECRIEIPERVWAGQIEKRTHLLSTAAVDSDWIMLLSADDMAVGNGAGVREQLATTDYDVLEVDFYTEPGEAEASTLWAASLVGRKITVPYFYRALPGFMVEDRHWHYSALKGGQRVWLWDQPDNRHALVPHGSIGVDFHIVHRTMSRELKQILANRAFCNDRVMVVEMTGQEDQVDGLPDPVWEYEERLV